MSHDFNRHQAIKGGRVLALPDADFMDCGHCDKGPDGKPCLEPHEHPCRLCIGEGVEETGIQGFGAHAIGFIIRGCHCRYCSNNGGPGGKA